MPAEVTLSVLDLAYFGQSRRAFELAGLGSRVSTIELFWDNYCALDPAQLSDDLAQLGDRVMFHIMWSRFLELDDPALEAYLTHLARHVRVLKPIAISDHLCRFRLGGFFVGAAQEYTYDHLDRVAERVRRYQDAIGMQLLIENNASHEQPVTKQVDFLHALMERTGCGVLFDISNAVVGELNGQGEVGSWLPLLRGRALRCHVGSYSHDDDVDRTIDSHDCDVSTATQHAIQTVCKVAHVESITYERDQNRDTNAIARDLVRIKESVCG